MKTATDMTAYRRPIGHWRDLRGALALLAAMVPLLRSPLIATATDIIVTSTDDTVDASSCTLRAAIIACNTQTATGGCPAGSGTDTITLAAGVTYSLTQVGDTTDGPSGLPSVTGTLTINGGGATVARGSASGVPPFRVLRVAPTGNLTLIDLTITNGSTSDLGGGILNTGTLTLRGSTVSHNDGLGGGGISNTGTLILTQTAVSNNLGSFGGGGVLNNTLSYAGPGGISVYVVGVLWVIDSTISDNGTLSDTAAVSGGNGGGIDNVGVATIIGSVVTRNRTGQGPDVADIPGGVGGTGGSGGGIANGDLGFASGTLTVTLCTISNNTTGPGGTGTLGDGGGFGGDGGGINNDYGTVMVSASTISGNTTGNGSTGTVLGGSGGNGGGIANGDTLVLVNTTISDNLTGNGGTGGAGLGSGSGGGGGGISNSLPGIATIVNSTISGNATGTGGCCGGFDSGGGIANAGTVTLASSTVSGNTAGVNRGGGLSNLSTGTMTFKNSIIATNSATDDPDCSGTLTSQGYNLIGNVSGCTVAGDSVGDIIGQDPMLGALQDNGGPTPTQALLAGSPAIDAGNPAGCTNANGAVLTRDQRGAARSRAGDTRCDIGSYEFDATVLPPCIGDCNDDGVVTVDEILVAVQIALGGLPSAACPALTTDGSDTVTIDDILQAIDSALHGCS
jgi:hypothetical protein